VNRQLSPGILKGEGNGVAIQLSDIGVNLTHRSFQSDREAVIRRAVAAGVVRLVNTGTTIRGSQDSLALSRAHPGTVTTTAAFPARLAARLPRWKHQPRRPSALLGRVVVVVRLMVLGQGLSLAAWPRRGGFFLHPFPPAK
jgi:hypothetical protein